MPELLRENQEFKGIRFTDTPLEKGAYEHCSFVRCTFEQGDLSEIIFVECDFSDCDLSMANLSGAMLQHVSFRGSKLMGIHFEQCKPLLFSVNFEKCDLSLSSFYGWSLKGAFIDTSKLTEVDFTGADLKGAVLKACDLKGAIFEKTNLEQADFRSSINYSIDPSLNRLKKTRFSADGIGGLLAKYDIIID